MAGRSANSGNWSSNSPATRYNVSGKNNEFYTFENAPGIGAYATGGTIIDGGDGYIYHIFTGTGTFQVNRPPAAIDSVDYLIVAGGGGGGAYGGGGGAGGLRFGSTSVSIGPYPISVGGGGSPGSGLPSTRSGTPSSAFGITATGGGGGGGTASPSPTNYPGAPGGSGGGAYGSGSSSGSGGTGNTPSTIPRQGYDGSGQPGPGGPTNGSGGGGAGGIGNVNPSTPSPTKGVGGPGRVVSEFPAQIVSRAFPSIPTWYSEVNTNGFARGGYGYNSNPTPNTPANTGYGGPVPGPVGTAGASGIVCIRYKKTAAYQRATGGTIEPNTHPEHPGVWRHIFTSPGNFTITDPTLQWIDYLAVGGGGGGGGSSPVLAGGGGGAGGFVSSIHTSTTTPTAIPEAYPWNPGHSVQVGEKMPVGVGTYPIVIGTGGDASTTGNDTTIGNQGASQIIAYGGGAGATAPGVGGSGGSGGGGAKISPQTIIRPGGTATPTPSIQGNAGGTTPAVPGQPVGGGGGGAGGSGGAGGPGGVGWYSVLSPSAYGTPGPLTPTSQYRYFAGGGGGYPVQTGSPGGGGGAGGTPTGNPGTTNTGGGGGGGFDGPGGTGGPGIVIIQYPE